MNANRAYFDFYAKRCSGWLERCFAGFAWVGLSAFRRYIKMWILLKALINFHQMPWHDRDDNRIFAFRVKWKLLTVGIKNDYFSAGSKGCLSSSSTSSSLGRLRHNHRWLLPLRGRQRNFLSFMIIGWSEAWGERWFLADNRFGFWASIVWDGHNLVNYFLNEWIYAKW